MSELGTLLELLYGARDRFRSVRATIREWQHLGRSNLIQRRVATAHGAPGVGAVMIAVSQTRGPLLQPEERQATVRLWAAGQRLREEFEDSVSGLLELRVEDGERWWSYSPDFGLDSWEARPGVTKRFGHEQILDPAPLTGCLVLQPAHEKIVGGRRAIVVRGRPRGREGDHVLSQLGFGADAYELAFDFERGILLSSAAYSEGKPFLVREVLEITFDEVIPPELFVFSAPPGATQHETSTVLHDLTVKMAAELAPFPVYELRSLGEGWRSSALYFEGAKQPPTRPAVLIRYELRDGPDELILHETTSKAPDPYASFGWRRLMNTRSDVRARASADYGGTAPTYLQLEQEGTRITLMSASRGLAELLELVERLVRAR